MGATRWLCRLFATNVSSREIVTDASKMFAGAHAGLKYFPGVAPDQLEEYHRLVIRELASGKTELSDTVLGGGHGFWTGQG